MLGGTGKNGGRGTQLFDASAPKSFRKYFPPPLPPMSDVASSRDSRYGVGGVLGAPKPSEKSVELRREYWPVPTTLPLPLPLPAPERDISKLPCPPYSELRSESIESRDAEGEGECPHEFAIDEVRGIIGGRWRETDSLEQVEGAPEVVVEHVDCCRSDAPVVVIELSEAARLSPHASNEPVDDLDEARARGAARGALAETGEAGGSVLARAIVAEVGDGTGGTLEVDEELEGWRRSCRERKWRRSGSRFLGGLTSTSTTASFSSSKRSKRSMSSICGDAPIVSSVGAREKEGADWGVMVVPEQMDDTSDPG